MFKKNRFPLFQYLPVSTITLFPTLSLWFTCEVELTQAGIPWVQFLWESDAREIIFESKFDNLQNIHDGYYIWGWQICWEACSRVFTFLYFKRPRPNPHVNCLQIRELKMRLRASYSIAGSRIYRRVQVTHLHTYTVMILKQFPSVSKRPLLTR